MSSALLLMLFICTCSLNFSDFSYWVWSWIDVSYINLNVKQLLKLNIIINWSFHTTKKIRNIMAQNHHEVLSRFCCIVFKNRRFITYTSEKYYVCCDKLAEIFYRHSSQYNENYPLSVGNISNHVTHMHIPVYTCSYTCTQARTPAHSHTYIHAHTTCPKVTAHSHTSTHTHTHAHTHTHTHAHKHTHTHTWTH